MTPLRNRPLAYFALGCLLVSTSCSSGDGGGSTTPPAQTIAQSLETEGLTTLRAALEDAGLLGALESGELTLFAPTNAAFDALPAGLLAGLTTQERTDLLLYHLYDAGAVPSSVALGLTEATMANGDDVIVDVVSGSLFINEALVIEADIEASNGVIHIIDRVLLPPVAIADALQQRGEFSTLLGAVTTIGGLPATPLTVLAPTDAAFDLLPPDFLTNLSVPELTDILTYHLIGSSVVASAALNAELAATEQGSNVLFALDPGASVNGVAISRFNIPCSDGVIHVLDAVLVPPSTIAATATDLGGFDTLVTALGAAGLDGLFDDPNAGPFTVFAPTDAAFAALPPGTLDALVNEPGTPTLIQILSYHAVGEPLTAAAVVAAVPDGILTLQGSLLDVAVAGDDVTIDGANVIATDVLCSNGLIHAIDAVLLPPGVILP